MHWSKIATYGIHSFFNQAIFGYLHGDVAFETFAADIIYFCNR